MSGLFNSYVIEPALRQARRFSASHDQSPQASQPTVLPSHAETDYLDLAQHDTTRTNSPVATRTHSPSRLVSTSLRDVADVPSGTIDLGSLRHTSAAVQDAPLATPANHLNTTSNVEMTLGNFRSMSLDAAPTHSFNPTHRASQQLRRSLHNSIDSRHARMDSASAEDDDGTSATTRSRNDSSGSSVISGALPANDGMLALRQKVHQIREMALSSEEKAKRMHALMTADYENYKASTAHERHTSHDAQTLPIGLAQRLRSLSPASTASTHDPDNKYNIDDEDLESTYCPASPISDSGNEPDETPEAYAPEHGCTHYKRNIKIQCFDCRRWYTCRLCHDEAVPEHHLERKKIQNMLCMFCKTPQPAAEYCKKCGTLAAQYYCDICKLWDNDARRRIYHCDDCGICRRGEGLGKDYVHCKKCNVCISIAYATTHRCVERATECDCPICGDYLFTSSASVVAMKCGHYIHKACYDAYMQTSYRCPICNRSAVNMELQWRKLDRSIEAQPMPEQYRKTKAWITCNDCTGRTCVSYHWLGNKCAECDSYNTNEVKVVDAPGMQSEADNAEEEQPPPRVSSEPDAGQTGNDVNTIPASDPITSSALASLPQIPAWGLSTLPSQPPPSALVEAAATSTARDEAQDAAPSSDPAARSSPGSVADDDDDDNASFWGEGIALPGPSTWHMPTLPLHMPRPTQLFRDRLSSDGATHNRTTPTQPRLFGVLRSPLARALSADAVPRPTLADTAPHGQDGDDDAVLPSREREGGWGLGPPAWLASRMQAFSRDAENTFFEAGGERAIAVAANPWDWRVRFGSAWERAVSDSVDAEDEDDAEARSRSEEADDDDDDDEEEADEGDDEAVDDVEADDDEEETDTFGLPGHR